MVDEITKKMVDWAKGLYWPRLTLSQLISYPVGPATASNLVEGRTNAVEVSLGEDEQRNVTSTEK